MAACTEVHCATAKSITSLYDLVPGDHIKTNGIFIDHHMIVVKVISEDTIRVIRKRKDQEAVVEEEVTCRPEDLTLLVYDSHFSGVEIVMRARERIGQSYNLVFANCEHFVTEVRTEMAVSLQVKTAGQWATNIVETFGLAIIAAIGFAIGVAISAMAAIRVLGATRSNQKVSPGGDCWRVGWATMCWHTCNGSHHVWRS